MREAFDLRCVEIQSTKCGRPETCGLAVQRRLGQLTAGNKTRRRPDERYDLVAMGGTFDVLHRGHRKLLRRALVVGDKILIGVTTDKFAHTLHKPHRLDTYAKRKRDLERLLSQWGVKTRARIVPLDDRYGPTVLNPRIQVLVVSRRTLKTAREINARRKRRGLRPLAIDPIDLILADDSRPISSTRIRRGRIDREGRLIERSRLVKRSKRFEHS